VNELRLAPDNPTKRTFLNALQKAAQSGMNGFLPHCAMMVLVPELAVLISKYEKDFVADLTHIYDNPEKYTAPRQTSDDVDIERPTLNLLAGTTPDQLGDTIPDSAWGQGFTSRIIFIYGTAVKTRRDVFTKREEINTDQLLGCLNDWHKNLHGPFDWEEPAQQAWDIWFNDEEMAPVPEYSRLTNYLGRRNEHVMKLAMISAVSAGNGLTVTLSDFRRAQKWLFDAETTMPDVFKAMMQKNDTQLLQDLYHHMYARYNSLKNDKRLAIREVEMWQFLEDKVPTERIKNLMDAAVKIGYFRLNTFDGGYIPNAKDFRGNQINV